MGKKLVFLVFLFFVISTAWSPSGHAQIVPSTTESLIVNSATVPNVVGTTFSIPVTLANARPVTGISGRLVFDRNLIEPIIVDSTVDTTKDTVFYTYSMVRVGRGTALPAFNAGDAGPGAVGFVLFSLDIADRINPGSGPICLLNFRVKTTLDTTICIRLVDDTAAGGLRNALSDTNTLIINPTLEHASLQIGAGSINGGCGPVTPPPGPGNDPPTINLIAAQTVPQGSILSFTVTASDPDGDNVTLSATTLPQNATFTTVTGDSVVSGTFTFSPSLSQVGGFTAVFRAVDDSGASFTRTASITVTEVLKDVLFSSSVTGKAPTGAIPGKKPAFFPIDLTARAQVYGVQFDLKFDTATIQIDSLVPTARLENFLIEYRNLGGQADRIRVLAFSLSGDSVRPATLPTIMNVALSVSPLALPGKSDIVIDSGFESVNPDPRVPSQSMLTQSGEFFIDRFGDANLDTLVNVADAVALVGFILGNYSFSVRQFDAANTNQDSLANIIDLVNIINLIFGVPLPPAVPEYIGPPANLALNARPFAFNSSEPIRLEAELPADIAGVQVHVAYNPAEVRLDVPQKTAASNNLILKYLENAPGKMSFVLYNMGDSRNEIPTGNSTILEIPATRLSGIGDTIPPKLTITRAFLSTGNGQGIPVAGVGANVPRQFELSQNYPNPFNPKTTIQFKVASADADGSPVPVKLEVFNILGQSVRTLVDDRRAPGTYTLEWDGTDRSGNRVSSGVYLYRLTSKDFSVTKKMVFLK
ncbi:MAG TPA: FlgD immunoglobulin-like domain containing protein [Verrucomicrobiae bacterium]|nr:FlgD immunoglobulin-like domain containing protein [Verrucomicrobiae bacterium]